MSELSEEQKRRIRAEEEERISKLQAEEEYRQQVRRELESETVYRQQVREEMEANIQPPPVEPSPPPVDPALPRQPKPRKVKAVRRPRMSRKVRIGFGGGMVVAGGLLVYYAYNEGFPIPGIDGPFRSNLTASADSTLEIADTSDWKPSDLAYDDWEVGDDGLFHVVPDLNAPTFSDGSPPPTSSRSTTEETGGATTTPESGTVPRDPVPTEPGRVSIAGGKVSIKVPSGWIQDYVEADETMIYRESDSVYVSFILRHIGADAPRNLLDLHSMHVADFSDLIEEFEILKEGDEHLKSGLTMKYTTIREIGVDDPYQLSIVSVMNNGRSVWIELDGTAKSFESLQDDLLTIVESLRILR